MNNYRDRNVIDSFIRWINAKDTLDEITKNPERIFRRVVDILENRIDPLKEDLILLLLVASLLIGEINIFTAEGDKVTMYALRILMYFDTNFKKDMNQMYKLLKKIKKALENKYPFSFRVASDSLREVIQKI